MKSFHDGKITLHAGDCLDVLKAMPENSIDAVVTDPPYHLTSIVKRFASAKPENEAYAATSKSAYMSRGFMGKQWDGGDIAFRPELWAEVLRVLNPGGHMVCFGGTRTYHRLACAIEDAGFEIRDAIMWHYGSGFPKSHDVSKGIDRAAGLSGSFGEYKSKDHAAPRKHHHERSHEGYHRPWQNDPDSCERTLRKYVPATDAARQWQGYGTALKPATEIICLARKPLSESTVAANVLRWGTGAINVDACRVGFADAADKRESTGKNQHADFGSKPPERVAFGEDNREPQNYNPTGRWPANLCHDGSPEVLAGFPDSYSSGGLTSGVGSKTNASTYQFGDRLGANAGGLGDSRCAARFFASFPQEETVKRFHYTSKADADDRLNSKHPTVKPVDLMQWLVRLVCPKGATVLDPFAGTGTTGAAAFIEGRRCVLIEREAEYLADIERRMELLLSGPDERARKLAKPEPYESLPLFGVA